MAPTTPVQIEGKLGTTLKAASPKVSVGFSTVFAALGTIAGTVASAVAAVKGNDPVSVVAAGGAIVTMLTTLIGRYGQALTLARNIAGHAVPYVDAVATMTVGDSAPSPGATAYETAASAADGSPAPAEPPAAAPAA